MGSRLFSLITLAAIAPASLAAQDPASGNLSIQIRDAHAAPLSGAEVTLVPMNGGAERRCQSDTEGGCRFALLRPDEYRIRASAPGMSVVESVVKVEVGSAAALTLTLRVAANPETVNVEGGTPVVETQPSAALSDVIDARALNDLPINGRRFSDLALLSPNVTQDPRGLTSSSNGDLAFGGVRGFNSTFLVDGSDNNNGFFAQARGRYRAPFQFSNEVVQEFRVSSNTYGVETGRSAAAVINVVTKSGNNGTHGSLFYYLRDGRTAATHPFVRKKYPDKQHQFGFTVGGPVVKDRVYYFAGFDQHIFHVPTVVQFQDGASVVTPRANDYEATDQALVFDAAARLSLLGGQFRSSLVGSSVFGKVDVTLTPRHHLASRVNYSRYSGENNVFLDPASPITNFAINENGGERVVTSSINSTLTSFLSPRWGSQSRVQFSRDRQGSTANSTEPLTRISQVISGFGRASILPRNTRENRWHVTQTFSREGSRHSVKLGADLLLTRITNHFPLSFGGAYTFDDIRVNPFTFRPQTFGLSITPLRAYAHAVPRFYSQNFGSSTSRPDTNEFAFFAQDTMRIGARLAISAGLRYDRQTMRSDRLVSNPLWPDSGKVPGDGNNFSPRIGLAASLGKAERPLVLRGGYGLFYTRIPSIFNSAVEIENGINRQRLSLDNRNFFAQQVFPVYPNPLVSCLPGAETCAAPSNVSGFLTTEISAFAKDFQTPYVNQASISAEKEIAKRTAIGVSYLWVAGKHLIRARDVNLPTPVEVLYPVFDDDDTTFSGEFYPVETFSSWRFSPSLTCPFPPCIDPLQRPVSNVGSINVFESAASSKYHGLTISAKRRMTSGMYFRMGYTWAKSSDNGQDGLVAGRPSQVQNSFATKKEQGRSATDQRHRLVFAWTLDPKPFGREHPGLQRIFNDWKFAGTFSAGSGRPLSGKINGDANRDGNSDNDRLPRASRNSFTGPDYLSGEMRVTRKFRLTEKFRMEALAESFNVFNRANKRVDISDDGFSNSAASFVPIDQSVGGIKFPGYFRKQKTFLQPTNAYAPRQVQFSLRLKF